MKNLIVGIAIGATFTALITKLIQKDPQPVTASDTVQTSMAAPAPSTSGKKITIGVSLPGADHSWLGAIKRNAETAAGRHTDVELIVTDAQNKSAKQMEDVETLIQKKVDVIVMLPHSGKALTPAAKKIRAAGIPLIVLDRQIESEDFFTLIRGNNRGIGVEAARFIGKTLGGKGKVIEVMGLAGISVTTQRHEGFIETLKTEYPGIQVLASVAADFNADKALTVTENLLQRHPDVQAIYSHDDDMNVGVLQAVKQLRKEQNVIITGAGGSKLMMEEIKSGTSPVKASFLYNPAMAGSAVNMARLVALKTGMPELWEPQVAREIVVQASAVTSENVDLYLPLGY